jgi:mannose-6-phosphate isomerase-like protein (cupin superfamily)
LCAGFLKSQLPERAEVDMRYKMIGIALLGLALATPASAQTTTHSTSTAGTVLATATLPLVTAVPLYVRLIGITLYYGEGGGFSAGNGILYQLSGTSKVIVDGAVSVIRPGEAIFVPGGKDLVVKADQGGPSTYLRFLVSPASDLDLPDLSIATGREMYRSTSPIPELKPGSYVLSLTSVTLPHQAPFDPPHHRSGAALHYVLTGMGAETVDGIAIAKGPGSMSYEPTHVVYQWGNPGNLPLNYLVFNLSPENERPVVAESEPNKSHL